MSDIDPSVPIYDETKLVGKLWWVGPAVSIIALGLTAVVLLQSFPVGPSTQARVLSLAAAWAVGAPLWFFAEYYFFYRKAPGRGSWELFQHGQHVSFAVWAGIVTALLALGTSDLVRFSQALECTLELQPGVSGSTMLPQVKCK